MENELDTEVLNSEENLDSSQETEEVVYQDNSELEKAKEIAENQRIRAEKAERELKALKKPVQAEKETPKNEGLSIRDVVALRDMHEEDALWLAEEAKLRGKTVSEMKADSYTQIILKAKADERKTAEATNTGSSRKSNSKTTSESLVRKAYEDKLEPEEMPEASKSVIADMFKK